MMKGGQGHFLQRENHLMGVILELSKVYNIGLATNGVIGNPMKTNDTKKAKKKEKKNTEIEKSKTDGIMVANSNTTKCFIIL